MYAAYGDCYRKWKDTDFFDDRRLYCNIMEQIIDALAQLPDDPCPWVCVAVNKLLDEDCETLDSIKNHFHK